MTSKDSNGTWVRRPAWSRPGSARPAVRPRYPNTAFEWLKADAHGLSPTRHLRTTSDFSVLKIGSYEIYQGGAGLVGVRRRQRMRENARLNIIAPRRISDHALLEAIENDQNRTQGFVRHIARPSRSPGEPQMQQSPDAATFVMKT